MQEKGKLRYYIPRGSFGSSAGVVLLILSVFFRLISYWGSWQSMLQIDQICYLALPISAALLMVLCLLLLSRAALWTTSLPVLLGVAYFMIRAIELDDKLFLVLWVLLCAMIAVLWCGTVFNVMHLRLLLPPLFLLPFLYRLWAVDLPALQRAEPPVSFTDGMLEMSVLGMLLAMFFISLGIRKRYKTKPEAAQSESPAEAPQDEAEPLGAAVPVQPEPEALPESESEPMPEPEQEAEPAAEAAVEKGGVFGKLFHRGGKKDPEVEPRIERSEEPAEPMIDAEPEPMEEPEAEESAVQEPEQERPDVPEQEENAQAETPETEEAPEAEDTDR